MNSIESTESTESEKLNYIESLVSQYGKEKATEILAINAGYSKIPPTIDEFLENPYYAGESTENGNIIYPKWREVLREEFPTPLSIRGSILSLEGCIGAGKSFIAGLSFFYELCKFLHIKDPHKYYRHSPATKYVFFIYAPTLGTASDVVYGQLLSFIKDSQFFQDIMNNNGGFFPNNISVEVGSRPSHSVGRAIVACHATELNFSILNNQSKTNIDSIIRRMQSRFMNGGKLPYHIYLDSSVSTDNSFMEKFAITYGGSGEFRSVGYPIWVIKGERGGYSKSKFPVFVGNDTTDPTIIDDEIDLKRILDNPETVDLLINVPTDFRLEFEGDLVTSIRDIAGISTSASTRFIGSIENLNEAMCNPTNMTRGIIRAGMSDINAMAFIDYISSDWLDLFISEEDKYNVGNTSVYDQIVNSQFGSEVKSRLGQVAGQERSDGITKFYPELGGTDGKIEVPKNTGGRSFHIDLGIVSDLVGIGCSYIEKFITVNRLNHSNGVESSFREPVFNTEWVLYAGATPNSELPIFFTKQLFVDLRAAGVPIFKITADGFQSRQLLQELKILGFPAEYQSVDRTKDAYLIWKRAMTEGRWKSTSSPRLNREFRGLIDNGKMIDHPEKGSKDGTDGVVGSIFNLFQNQDAGEIEPNDGGDFEVLDSLIESYQEGNMDSGLGLGDNVDGDIKEFMEKMFK